MSKQPAQPVPENLDAVKAEVTGRWGVVSLLDLLKEADWLTDLHTEFTSIATREHLTPAELRKRLLLVLFALGTNIDQDQRADRRRIAPEKFADSAPCGRFTAQFRRDLVGVRLDGAERLNRVLPGVGGERLNFGNDLADPLPGHVTQSQRDNKLVAVGVTHRVPIPVLVNKSEVVATKADQVPQRERNATRPASVIV